MPDDAPDGFEESARIVEAFASDQTDATILALLDEITRAIRERAIDA